MSAVKTVFSDLGMGKPLQPNAERCDKSASTRTLVHHPPQREHRLASSGALDYADVDGNGGGGAPFSTREELDEYVRHYGLRPYEQLTLGI
ncbi:hypothetical protein [Alicyclobacillus pomorum]|uniref:hypothetical protein n=1 Tax=Alicyclobacillus pomorum TaxID=204470 RepID=UPI00047A0F5C|nr:hypothetical protein [Alicyclobacillus pomorum]